MAKITYVATDGERTTVDVPAGWSVMEGAVRNSIAGIDAECGGCCAYATCHVYVAPEWQDRLPSIEDTESDMLTCTASERRDTSRLSCQIKVTDALDGLVVEMPESQV